MGDDFYFSDPETRLIRYTGQLSDPAATSGQVLTVQSDGFIAAAAAAGGLFSAYAMVADQRAANTQGGTSVSSTWNVRPIQTEVFDPKNIVTVAANRFTLGAGTYYVQIWSTVLFCDHNMVKLVDVAGPTDILTGLSQYSTSNGDVGELQGRFTIAGSTTYEVQHYTSNGLANVGMGTPLNAGVAETYGVVLINKES